MPKAIRRIQQDCHYKVAMPWTAETKRLRIAGQEHSCGVVTHLQDGPEGTWRKLDQPLAEIMAEPDDIYLSLEGAGIHSDDDGYYFLIEQAPVSPEAIVWLLANGPQPLDGEYGNCLLCDAPGFTIDHLEEHAVACPYRLAIEWKRTRDTFEAGNQGEES